MATKDTLHTLAAAKLLEALEAFELSDPETLERYRVSTFRQVARLKDSLRSQGK